MRDFCAALHLDRRKLYKLSTLRVRSPAGIRLLGQFALVLWPNLVHWAADWIADQVQGERERFDRVLREVRTQVRTAANTPATVLTNMSGQLVEFADDGPYACQFPMPLFQRWEQRWPISSETVKERVSALMAEKGSQTPIDTLFVRSKVRTPEKVVKTEPLGRLPP